MPSPDQTGRTSSDGRPPSNDHVESHHDGVVDHDGAIDPAFRRPLSYIDRSRRYYAAKGYDNPYRWAANRGAPFAPLDKPLAECRVAIVTTSFPVDGDATEAAPPPEKEVQAVRSEPVPERMFTNDLFWHKKATHTDDVECFLPLRALTERVEDGSVGSVNHRFFCVPTEYSQRATAADAEAIERWCREDEVDLVLLIPL